MEDHIGHLGCDGRLAVQTVTARTEQNRRSWRIKYLNHLPSYATDLLTGYLVPPAAKKLL